MNILWVEDKRFEIRALENKIREHFDVLTIVTNVDAAEHQARASQFDWILVDSSFPNSDRTFSHSGVAFFRKLRAGEYGDYGKLVRVWFLTNWAEHVQDVIRDILPPPEYVLPKTPLEPAIDAWSELLARL